MHMGYFAANNLAQQMQVAMGTTKEPEMKELAEIPAMIGLAVGKKAVAYWPEAGVTSGEDVNKAFFGDDLGFTSESFRPSSLSLWDLCEGWCADGGVVCWNHLGLGGDKKE
jgi:hypothetical protein